jgi:23S rRNA pseudouridine1911/1915/1917 synthase
VTKHYSEDEDDVQLNEELANRPLETEAEEAPHVTLHVRRRLVGRRLDKYMHARFPRLSRTLIQRLIKQGAILVNGKPAKASYEPDGGDRIDIDIPPPEPYDVIAEDIPLDIVYEDDHIIGLNKQNGIIVHPSKATQGGTLANGLAYYANSLSNGDDPFRPGIVHRLDKHTTGILVIAKNDEAHWRISMQFERRTVRKTYLAVVEGNPELDSDIIDAPLSAHPTVKDRYIVPAVNQKVKNKFKKHATTEYKVAERYRGYALVHLHPKTGRTHQLRVHMSYIGHPMAGDTSYGGHLISEKRLLGEGSESPIVYQQALHAYRLQFMHPITEKEITLEAPPPPDMARLIHILREHRAQ